MALLDKVSGELNLYIGGYVLRHSHRLSGKNRWWRKAECQRHQREYNTTLTVMQTVHAPSKGIAPRSWYYSCAFGAQAAGGAGSLRRLHTYGG
jgi:hypothetical protein